MLPSGTATLKAGTSINLKPRFTAGSGNNFTAKIRSVSNVAKRFYYLKDHLGSIRVVVDETGNVVSSDDGVYPALSGNPWGMVLAGRSGNDGFTDAKYKFTGKERDVETGYDYFGARYYDPTLGRWHTMDPADEFHSPYVYVGNNPVKFIDPDGAQVLVPKDLIDLSQTYDMNVDIDKYATYHSIVDNRNYLEEAFGPIVQSQVEFDQLAATGKYSQLVFTPGEENKTYWRIGSEGSYYTGRERSVNTNGMQLKDLQVQITLNPKFQYLATNVYTYAAYEEIMHALLIRNAVSIGLPVPTSHTGLSYWGRVNLNHLNNTQHGLLAKYFLGISSDYLPLKDGKLVVY